MVPGRKLLVPLLQVNGPLDALERSLAKAWPRLMARVGEDELAVASREVAARLAADVSGPLGQARSCAAVAAGTGPWRSSEDLERTVLAVSGEELSMVIEALPAWPELLTTGAGVLPVPGTPRR